MGKILFTVIIVGALFGAFITNPSETDAKKMVKTAISEKLNDKFANNLKDDQTSTGNKIGSALGLMFGSKVVDAAVDVNVKNYYIFSSFDADAPIVSSDNKPVVSGIILFGKIIPTSTNLPDSKD